MSKVVISPASFVSLQEIQKLYQISGATLRRWANHEEIKCVRLSTQGKRLYQAESVAIKLGIEEKSSPCNLQTQKLIYARVSSAHQKADLERQIADLQFAYPGYEVISDIGSGLNFKRKGLLAFLERVFQGLVQ